MVIFEGPPRASGWYERTGGSRPFRHISGTSVKEDDDVFGPARISTNGADQAASWTGSPASLISGCGTISTGTEAAPYRQARFERLRDEHGFRGGYSTVKNYVQEHGRRSREMFVPLAHFPGHAQADFGEAMVVIGGVEQRRRISLRWICPTAMRALCVRILQRSRGLG